MKTAIVTGGTKGIGKANVLRLVNNGWKVVFCYKNSFDVACEITEKFPAAIGFKADVSKEEEVKNLFEFAIKELGHLDAVICNAGIAGKMLFTDTSVDDWNNIFSVNTVGTFLCCRYASKIMIKQKYGSIVTTSSIFGETGGSCEVAYSASKAAVIGLTKALAKELGPSNIRVNCVSPGVIDTDMNGCLSKEDISCLAEETPLERIGQTEDIAKTVEFLADNDKSSFITGQVLSVNGGLNI